MAEPKDFLDKRMVNALFKDAALDRTTGKVMGMAGKLGLKAAEKLMGGLWVGGTAYLTADTVEFHANALNKAVHAAGSVNAVVFPLSEIESTDYRETMMTHIVDLTCRGQTLSIRGYNMRAFHDAICQAVEGARQP